MTPESFIPDIAGGAIGGLIGYGSGKLSQEQLLKEYSIFAAVPRPKRPGEKPGGKG